MERKTCHDCGCKEGELHEYGCDMERCPFCGGQLISCDCVYDKLGFNHKNIFENRLPMDICYGCSSFKSHFEKDTSGLPREIYENGLGDELTEQWMSILNRKGRVPYIVYPNKCEKCGELWPEMFNVSDEDWQKYVRKDVQNKMLCKKCYDQIKKWIDKANKENK